MIRKAFRRLFPTINIDGLKADLHNTQIQQRHLFSYYQNLKATQGQLPNFADSGFRVFSQCDEDGKIMYIFSIIGFLNKKCIDMAFASPYGANTTNLIINWGFSALLVEGSDLRKAELFFRSHSDTCVFPPACVKCWITAENVNEICINNGFSGEIDFFSLDMDGIDYHIWEALSVVQPRVIVVEYQDILGPTEALTVPYKCDFNRFDIHPDFFSASLSAFVKLGKIKDYRLIGTNRLGYNAFFLKNGIGEDVFPEISVGSCFDHPKVKKGMESRFPPIKDLPWVKV